MTRVLVVDDVASARRVIREVLEQDPEITVVGEAADGVEAVALVEALRPDVVTMDVLMPRLDGYEATARIMAVCPTPVVAVTSLSLEDGSVVSRMFEAGAVDVLSKAFSREGEKWVLMQRELVSRVKAAARCKPMPAAPNGKRLASRMWKDDPERPPRGFRPRVVVIAASTGGPMALSLLLKALPEDFALPVLVVQHISDGFATWLAEWLGTTVRLPVKVAQDAEVVRPGHVYLGPDGYHMLVLSNLTIRLNRALPVQSVRPAADVLFRSAAQAFGPAVLGVVLTGMGEDGTEGARAIKEAGGYVIAQDEESCAVFGMPRAAIAAGVVDAVLPLAEIARRMAECDGRERQ